MVRGVGKYTTMGSTPLPQFVGRRAGRRRRLRWLFMLGVCLFMTINALMWCSILSLDAEQRDDHLLSLRASPGPPVMTTADALAALYAWSSDRVLLSRNSSIPCVRQHIVLLVADMDEASCKGSVWESYVKRGSLCCLSNGSYTVVWVDEVPIRSSLNERGRGMELSTLTWFNGKV